jgi:hypothetical protein
MGAELQLRGVHVYGKVPNQPGMFRLIKTNPYMRFGHQDQSLFIQNGQVFYETGGPLAEKDLPGWFKAAVEQASKAALRECGWKG